MNWKITRVGHWIEFRAGEPCCMLVPVPRGLASGLDPQRASLASDPELHAQYSEWQVNRERFLRDLDAGEAAAVKAGWQKDYFQGVTADGRRFQHHETRSDLKSFRQS